MYSAPIIANYFIKKGYQENIDLNLHKLMKLLVLSQVWYLGYFSKPLMEDNIVAAKYGLIIPNILVYFGNYESKPIKDLIGGFPDLEFESSNNPYLKEYIEKIWEVYKNKTGVELADILLAQTDLYQLSKTDYSVSKNGPLVPNELIKDRYKKIIEKTENNKLTF